MECAPAIRKDGLAMSVKLTEMLLAVERPLNLRNLLCHLLAV